MGEYEQLNVLFNVTIKGFWGSHVVPKFVKITWNITFGHISLISTSRKLEMDTFSGSTNLWRLLEKFEPLDILHW